MPLYFAYGANMDAGAMAVRCPRSKAIGVARLVGYRFIIFRDGFASVKREPGATVHGLLWQLAFADIPALDRFEETAAGLYTKIVQPVVVQGGARRALLYLGRSEEPGVAVAGYVEPLVASAEALGFPTAYLKELRTWLPRQPAIRR